MGQILQQLQSGPQQLMQGQLPGMPKPGQFNPPGRYSMDQIRQGGAMQRQQLLGQQQQQQTWPSVLR